jgi:hypothetical protein
VRHWGRHANASSHWPLGSSACLPQARLGTCRGKQPFVELLEDGWAIAMIPSIVT